MKRAIFTILIVVPAWAPTAALAQGPAPTSSGSFSSTYEPQAWGQYGQTTWGTYSNRIGPSGWNYNQQLTPTEPTGSVLVDPNQNSVFATGGTSHGLFQIPDTRLKGRDRP
jgi:hypothetical protein